MNDLEQGKINFLSMAISDAQELIRFTDGKTAVAITILGSYIIGIFISVDSLILHWAYHSSILCILLILMVLSLILCILVIKRIIRPTNNPIENVQRGTEAIPTPYFYIAVNQNSFWFFLSNSDKNKLQLPYTDYLQQINSADAGAIIKTLSFELLKVSFIRNIKNDRFNFLVKCIVVTTFLFLLTYSVYLFETENAKAIIEIKQRTTAKIEEHKKETQKVLEHYTRSLAHKSGK